MKARNSRTSKPHKGNKHTGIYGTKKDITPMPKSVHVSINIPIKYVCALQEKYPDLTLYKAVQTHLIDTILLIKEI